MRQSLNEPNRAAALASAIMTLCLVIGALIGRLVLPLHNAAQKGSVFDHLLSWDGRIYYDVARHGYVWNPAYADIPGHYQSIAFFPLQAMIDRVLVMLAGGGAAGGVVLVACGFGIVSVFSFARLAFDLLDPPAAARATLLFALWPAASFYAMGYPTGLISICIIEALSAHLGGRYWRSAVWAGLGTAAAPTIVFVIAALGIDRGLKALRETLSLRRLLDLIGWGLLSISGLLGFMLYQLIRFGDPRAYMKAQAAWGTAPPFTARLLRLFDWHWYVQQPHAGMVQISRGLAMWHSASHASALWQIQSGIQRLTNISAMILVVAGLLVATFHLRKGSRVVARAGWFVLAGYLWFIFTTNQNMLDVPRLLFPAVALFLGLGAALNRSRLSGPVVIGLFGTAVVMETAFAAAGYWVV